MGKPTWLLSYRTVSVSLCWKAEGCKGQKHIFLSITMFHFFEKILYIEKPIISLLKSATSWTPWCLLHWQTGILLIKVWFLHSAIFTGHWVPILRLLASEAESSVITSSLSFTSDLQWPKQAALQSLCSFASDSSGCLFKALSFSLWIASFPDCRTGHFSWVLSALEKYLLDTYIALNVTKLCLEVVEWYTKQSTQKIWDC